MKHSGWQSLAASSLLLATLAAHAGTRPQYGGMLHVSMREALTSLDPADTAQPDSFARRNVTLLVFETLVVSDGNGRVRPALATSWQAMDGNQRWQFRLRKGIMFHDGAALTPSIAASSLRAANTQWRVMSTEDSITIECGSPCLRLPEELALPRNAITKKNGDGKLVGTGPFHITEWQPGKTLLLGAEENYWAGRPFLDAIEIEMGKSFHEQLISLELGKADLIETPAEQERRISLNSNRVATSKPMELTALVFAGDAPTAEEKTLREALALCIERASMGSVILQGTGQPAASILPNWMSGYGFTFSAEPDLARARHLRESVRTAPAWTIAYDAADPIAGLLAQRIALNARDAGLQLQPTKGAAADLRLVKIPLWPDPVAALEMASASVGLPPPQINSDSAQDLYSAERALLATQRLIPLFHLPAVYAASATLRDWWPQPDGEWNLADAWLAREEAGSGLP